MKCRPNCGACCIAPSISSPIPGMPKGKPAGVKCIHLDDNYLCEIFDSPLRPKVCGEFEAEEIICGKNRDEALRILNQLEL
jgi:Fe-S-cluster containining protein